MGKTELMGVLKKLLKEVLEARYEGVAYARLARAHGYADGYMRALIDAGLMNQEELISLVGNERQRFITEDDKRKAAAKEEERLAS